MQKKSPEICPKHTPNKTNTILHRPKIIATEFNSLLQISLNEIDPNMTKILYLVANSVFYQQSNNRVNNQIESSFQNQPNPPISVLEHDILNDKCQSALNICNRQRTLVVEYIDFKTLNSSQFLLEHVIYISEVLPILKSCQVFLDIKSSRQVPYAMQCHSDIEAIQSTV